MADPTIQTFCCHHNNGTDLSLALVDKFDSDAYNGVCMLSASLGIFGAIYQIWPREALSPDTRQWVRVPKTRGRRIISALAVADFLAALGVFIRSSVWLGYKNIMPGLHDESSVIYCAISSAFTQYFYTATWIWTLCYAIDMRFTLKDRNSKLISYHIVAWVIPAILTTLGLTLLYYPDANCHATPSKKIALTRILPNYLATYGPIALVMITNPCLYRNSSHDMTNMVTSVSGQFTVIERRTLDIVRMKFCLINTVFYLCWLPNIINGILLWTLWFHLPVKWIIALWYIMALLNPLQAFFNCLVYRKWNTYSERIILPWKRHSKCIIISSRNASQSSNLTDEGYPLLQSPQSIINGYHIH